MIIRRLSIGTNRLKCALFNKSGPYCPSVAQSCKTAVSSLQHPLTCWNHAVSNDGHARRVIPSVHEWIDLRLSGDLFNLFGRPVCIAVLNDLLVWQSFLFGLISVGSILLV
jgi:hypothetical protein